MTNYRHALLRNVTAYKPLIDSLGIGFDMADGSVVRIRLAGDNARKLSEILSESFSTQSVIEEPEMGETKVNFDENMQKLRGFLADSGWTPRMLIDAGRIFDMEQRIFAGHDPVMNPVTGQMESIQPTPKR